MDAFHGSRRAIAWVMLGLYGLVASGLPLPVGGPPAGSPAAEKRAGKDRSRPFPCMNKPCGCGSAEQCFTNCCCHTPAEILAWAEARGIEAAVLAALERRVAAATPAVRPTGDCCSTHDDCASPDEVICSDYQSLAADPVDPESAGLAASAEESTDQEPTVAADIVILRAMLACGGIVSEWAAVGVSLPPPTCVTCELPWPPVGVVTVIDERVFGTGSPPDTPPPRV